MGGLLSGRTAVVTGASGGIGLGTAVALARLGARVVAVGRTPDKSERALETIRRDSGSEQVELVLGDLSTSGSTRELAAKLIERCPRVHVLVNNAGGYFPERRANADGIEMTLAVNHLGPFLLTNLLLPALLAAAPARIVNVSSMVHSRWQLQWDDLQGERDYRPFRAYALSKLCNVLFTVELARRLEGKGVTANSLHPGTVAGDIAREASWPARAIYRFGSLFMASPARGARTSVYLASSPDVAEVSGQYFSRRKARRASSFATQENARRLWEESARLTGLAQD